MTTHRLETTIALLTRTPAALHALLRELPDEWISTNEGPDTWSVSEVVAHLAHAERADWMPRVRVVLNGAPDAALPPFDRLGHRRSGDEMRIAHQLDEFTALRQQSLAELRALDLSDHDFTKTARHPSFGTITLSQLLATWAAHDLTHLHQITRVMAHQYRPLVGPWQTFLGVMKCGGHSAAP